MLTIPISILKMKFIFSLVTFILFLTPAMAYHDWVSKLNIKDSKTVERYKHSDFFIPKGSYVHINGPSLFKLSNPDNIEIVINGIHFFGDAGISFHENNQIKYGILSKKAKLNGYIFEKYTPISFDEKGELIFLGGTYKSHASQEWFPIDNCFLNSGKVIKIGNIVSRAKSYDPSYKIEKFSCTLNGRVEHHGIQWPKGSLVFAKVFDNNKFHIWTAWIPNGINFKGMKNEIGLEIEYCLKDGKFIMIGPWVQDIYDSFDFDSDCNNRKGARFLKN